MTQNIFNIYRDLVLAAVSQLGLPEGLSLAAITVEPPRDAAHGDLASNAAMVLAKPAGINPRALAEKLAEMLRNLPDVTAVDVAGPGFINLRLHDRVWQHIVSDILMSGSDYGRSSQGQGRRANVEYVSANPTGPMHMGHCRGAVVGDVLANLMAYAGYKVTKEYYINDAGSQVDTLARSAHLRYREALGENIGEIPEGFYPGDYLKPVGALLAAEFGDKYNAAPEADWLRLFKQKSVAAMMELIRDDLAVLGVHHDHFYSEQSMHDDGKIDAAMADLEAKGFVYTGVLEPPKGEVPDDWEQVPLLLFRATQFGDDVDRPLKKSSGAWTYFGADIAYHREKALRSDLLINIWGADHSGAIKRIKAAVEAITARKNVLDVQLVQMVRLLRNGEPVKMSKRSGNFVTLAEVVEEVGRGVVRFIMLTRKSDSQLDFDFAKVVEQSKDNPVFYVQYAYARICSALTKAKDINHNVAETSLLSQVETVERLVRAEELALVRQLAMWPRAIEQAAEAHEPHRIAFYLHDLASGLHALWNAGNDDPTLRFALADDPVLTLARSALITAVRQVLRNGLNIMGVDPIEEM
jgi:arginyl-tRNA synthetase